MPSALITGITGQDGTYLAEHLLAQGYQVHGLIRGQQNPKRSFVRTIVPDVDLLEGDLLDEASLRRAFERAAPDEVYNLGAISFVQYSFSNPLLTAQITGLAVLRLLELIREEPRTRFYQASTSEMFGLAADTPSPRQHRSILGVRMGSRRRSRTTAQPTIVRRTACSPSAGSFSIMNHPAGAWSS